MTAGARRTEAHATVRANKLKTLAVPQTLGSLKIEQAAPHYECADGLGFGVLS